MGHVGPASAYQCAIHAPRFERCTPCPKSRRAGTGSHSLLSSPSNGGEDLVARAIERTIRSGASTSFGQCPLSRASPIRTVAPVGQLRVDLTRQCSAAPGTGADHLVGIRRHTLCAVLTRTALFVAPDFPAARVSWSRSIPRMQEPPRAGSPRAACCVCRYGRPAGAPTARSRSSDPDEGEQLIAAVVAPEGGSCRSGQRWMICGRPLSVGAGTDLSSRPTAIRPARSRSGR